MRALEVCWWDLVADCAVRASVAAVGARGEGGCRGVPSQGLRDIPPRLVRHSWFVLRCFSSCPARCLGVCRVSNEDGIEFYKRHQFEVGEKLLGYYKNITPPDGLVMTKKVGAK